MAKTARPKEASSIAKVPRSILPLKNERTTRTKKSRNGWAPWWSSTLQPSGTTADWVVLLIKGYAVAVQLDFVDGFKKNVRKYLFTKGVTTSHDIWTVGQALWLHVKSSDSSVSSMARVIIEGFDEFKTFGRQIFNKKAGCVNFQQALGNLKCDQVDFTCTPYSLASDSSALHPANQSKCCCSTNSQALVSGNTSTLETSLCLSCRTFIWSLEVRKISSKKN